ncbi:hypothetical protein KC614_00745 [candidate division WWE3 bacterium]|uniref:DUF916 domain-containing protein n=1 Tax=candidate division WWE3 bacterium TaxID=2053526 RepID=A0A955LK25_UNCKA|nr:hypothetical protein [candidate division WWE3 bacterium]
MRRTPITLFAIMILSGVLFVCQPVGALTLLPSINDLTMEAGGSTEVMINVVNEEDADYQLSFDVNDVRFTRSGIPQFVEDSENQDDPSSIVGWFKLPFENYDLSAGTELALDARIDVPSGTAPGGYYAAVLVRRKPVNDPLNNDEFEAKIEAQGAVLVYITVKGDVKGAYAITEVQPLKKVYFSLPIEFVFKLQNEGNVHLQPHGLVSVTNVLTDKVEASILFNEDSVYLMPKTDKEFSVVWDTSSASGMDLRFGKYRADVAISAQYGGVYQTQLTFWIVPVPALAVVAFVFLVVLVTLLIVRKRLILKAKKS